MSIKDQITADLKDAMRARDQLRLDTLRSVISAFNYRRIEAARDFAYRQTYGLVGEELDDVQHSIDKVT